MWNKGRCPFPPLTTWLSPSTPYRTTAINTYFSIQPKSFYDYTNSHKCILQWWYHCMLCFLKNGQISTALTMRGRNANIATTHLSTSSHSGPEPEAEPPLMQVKGAKWSLTHASWDHPQGFFCWLRSIAEHYIVAMALSVLDMSQTISNTERKKGGSGGMRFQLFPSRGFPFAMEIQKDPLNCLCTATKTWDIGPGQLYVHKTGTRYFFSILLVQIQARSLVASWSNSSMERFLSPSPVCEGHKCSLQNYSN